MTITQTELEHVLDSVISTTALILVVLYFLAFVFSSLISQHIKEKEFKNEKEYKEYQNWLEIMQDDKNGEDYK